MANILILTAALIVSVIIGEIAARALNLSKTYSSYPWRLKEGEKTRYRPEKNSDGYRDREFVRSKPEGVFRIACIGDSVTEGYRVALDKTFSKLLEQNLGKNYGEIEVMNLGVSGYATTDNMRTLALALDFDPDIIIYQFGMNDIEGFEHIDRAGAETDTPSSTEPPREPFSIKSLLRKSVLYLALAERYNYLKLTWGKRNWAFDEWNITFEQWEKEFAKLKQGFDEVGGQIPIVMIYIPYDFQVFSPREEVFDVPERISVFCEAQFCYFLDFTAVFKDEKNPYGLFLDDCHLSEYGHRIVAERLSDFIAREIVEQ